MKKRSQTDHAIIEAWITAKENLKAAQETEKNLRLAVAKMAGTEEEGTHTISSQGLTIKVVNKYNRTVDMAAVDANWDNLSEKEKGCFAFKPSLVLKNYREVSSSMSSAMVQCIVTRKGMPTIEVK